MHRPGVKIEPTNNAASRAAASNGQIDRIREVPRWSGCGVGELVTSTSRRRREAGTTGGFAGSLPQRLAHATTGIARSCSRRRRGGRPFERAGVPRDCRRRARRARRLTHDVDERTAAKLDDDHDRADASTIEVQRAPAHRRPDRCRRAAACPQAEDVHREERDVEADEERARNSSGRASRSASGR